MKNKYKLIGLLLTAVSALFIIFLCLFLSYFNTCKTYRNQLENLYEKNYYETVSAINSLEVNMSKLVATTDLKSQSELLRDISENCTTCSNNIGLLPLSYNKVTEINSLINTISGFIESLSLANLDGDEIGEEDFNQLNSVHSRVQEVQYDLNLYLNKLKADYNILDDVDFNNSEQNLFSGGLVGSESNLTKIPTLIYDGPFSDSVINKEIKGLENVEYTVGMAEEKLHSIFSGFAIEYLGDSEGKFSTYNFDVKGDVDLYVSVTKLGGFLLNITAFGSGDEIKLSTEDGVALAEAFASDCGLKNMYSVWYQQTGNILYVNLAPIVNKVIYYPDLIKVKVDLSYGLVVGWEGVNYATNHVDRSFVSSVGILEAQEKISPILTVTERNFTIIPDKYVGELSAYEFICTWKNYTYYIYIDSVTGEEANILRVVNTTNGDLLM
ncbi:MAG: hypothetical protein E7345_02425 [Clostridiales bacterium]|nr:hypothetical protein [Clostridiales bacterium]